MGIHVVRLGGGPAGPLAALVRTLLLCLVIPAVIFDPDHRGLHDKAMNTVLVRMYSRGGCRSGVGGSPGWLPDGPLCRSRSAVRAGCA